MLSDCWAGLGAGTSTAGAIVTQGSIGPDASNTNCATSTPAVSSIATAARSSNPARILRKLRTSGPTALRTESTEEASSASVEMLALSSTGSLRSRASRGSLETGAAVGSNNNNNKVRVTKHEYSRRWGIIIMKGAAEMMELL
jgi:hypothetical protein